MVLLSHSEVDTIYDWLQRVPGLPTELCVAALTQVVPPTRRLSAIAGLVVAFEEAQNLLFNQELVDRLPDLLLDFCNSSPETRMNERLGSLLQHRKDDSTGTALKPIATWSSNRMNVPELSAELATWQLRWVGSKTRASERRYQDLSACRALAKRIFCRIDAISSLAFRLPVMQGPQEQHGGRFPDLEGMKWDYQLCLEPFRVQRAWGLAVLASETPMAESQEQELVRELVHLPAFALLICLPAVLWNSLAENSPHVAVGIAKHLLRFEAGTELLKQVATQPPTLHLMEIFGLLFVEIEPPPELVMAFVANWIQETSRTREETQQSRLARLLSVFASSLIRQGSPVPFAIEELEAFALEHSRVKEAAELFRLLKAPG